MQNIPIAIIYQGMLLSGYALPLQLDNDNFSLKIFIKGWDLGTLSRQNERWTMDQPIDPAFISTLGKYIEGYMHAAKKAMHCVEQI